MQCKVYSKVMPKIASWNFSWPKWPRGTFSASIFPILTRSDRYQDRFKFMFVCCLFVIIFFIICWYISMYIISSKFNPRSLGWKYLSRSQPDLFPGSQTGPSPEYGPWPFLSSPNEFGDGTMKWFPSDVWMFGRMWEVGQPLLSDYNVKMNLSINHKDLVGR